MKRIIAFVRPNMLDDVVFALHELPDFPGATISEVKSIGQGVSDRARKSNRAPFHGFPVRIRMEIACRDNQADMIVDIIRSKAHTGLADDGAIHIAPVEAVVQIRTGAREETVH